GEQQVPEVLLKSLQSGLESSGWSVSNSPTSGLHARYAISGTVGDGWLTLGLYVPVVLLALLPRRGWWGRSWRGGWVLVYAVPSRLASTVAIYDLVNFFNTRPGLTANPDIRLVEMLYHANITVTSGPGLYIVAAAGIVSTLLAFVLRGPAQPPVPEKSA